MPEIQRQPRQLRFDKVDFTRDKDLVPRMGQTMIPRVTNKDQWLARRLDGAALALLDVDVRAATNAQVREKRLRWRLVVDSRGACSEGVGGQRLAQEGQKRYTIQNAVGTLSNTVLVMRSLRSVPCSEVRGKCRGYSPLSS